jgi:PleD family two-component response regulator
MLTVSVGVATTQGISAERSDEPSRANAQTSAQVNALANAERECQALLHRADQALYVAKERGRDTVAVQEETSARPTPALRPTA